MSPINTHREQTLHKMLEIIRANPGIRPKDINRRLNREHSASLRNTLIKRGLVRKQKYGVAVRYNAIIKSS